MITLKTITEDMLTFVNGCLLSHNRNINVYPQAAVEGTKVPFIIYHRTNIDDMVTKDGLSNRKVSYDIDIVTNDYITGVEIVDELTEAFYYGQLQGQRGYDRKVNNIVEMVDAENNLFIQTISITIEAY